jgi:hypothetical protein
VELILGGLVLAALLALVFGGLTGRLRLNSCCAPADASRDLRMREAFEHDRDDPAIR